MIKLKIIKIDAHNYYLKDSKNNKYSVGLRFYGLENDVEVNDYIFICEKLFDQNYDGYCGIYSFGLLDDQCGKDNVLPYDEDFLAIKTKEKNIILKRLYG